MASDNPDIGGVVCGCLLPSSGRSVDMHTVAQQVVGAIQIRSLVWTIIGLTRAGVMEPAGEIHYQARTW